MSLPTAFHGDPAVKAALLARIDAHLAAGTLLFERTCWHDGRGSALGVSIGGTDPAVYADAFGYPLNLAALLDPLAGFPADGFDTPAFVRDWVDAVAPGADLRLVPTRVMLEMLDARELRGCYEPVLTGIITLHLRDLGDDVPSRAEWAAVRTAVLALPDDATDWKNKVKRMLEAACWTATRGRSVLVEALTAFRGLVVREPDPDWSHADECRTHALFETLATEQRALHGADVRPDYPALFDARDTDLSRRFISNLTRVNRRFDERGAEVARHCIAILQSTSTPAT